MQKDVIIIGGGAAGFFAAINIAEQRPDLKVAILERGKEGLTKVKISGGGRCNVTHAEFLPLELTKYYPRGEKELLGPFHKFMTGDTIAWFEERGVPLKIEDDGRMFPQSNSSQTIIDCFLNEAKTHGVEVLYNHAVKTVTKEDANFHIQTTQGDFTSKHLMVATGSNPKIWQLLETFGHTIAKPVPSLFTFNITDERIKDIPGVVVKNVAVRVKDTNLYSEGPLLITHWGLSAPSILKLSAFGAIALAARDYKFQIEVNFIKTTLADCLASLKDLKQEQAKKAIFTSIAFGLPKRLWHKLVLASGLDTDTKWADVNKAQLERLAKQLTQAVFNVEGKSTFKEEFVTAGGVHLKEINFKTFESKYVQQLYFAGEVLNIDAVTGGFNFQNAWTSAYIAAKTIANLA